MKKNLQRCYERLSSRERCVLLLGVVFVALCLIYYTIVVPLEYHIQRLTERVQQQMRLLHRWERQPLMHALSMLKASFSAAHLDGSLAELSQVDNKVVLRFNSVAFDAVMDWLQDFERNYAVQISVLTIKRQSESGKVNIELHLCEFDKKYVQIQAVRR